MQNIRGILFTYLATLSCLDALILDIPLEDVFYEVESVNGYDRIRLNTVALLPYEPGYPEIPAFVCHYIIPKDQVVTEVAVVAEEWTEETGLFTLYPRQRETSLESASAFTEPVYDIYNSSTPFPQDPIIAYECGNLRGYRILQLAIAPIRYLPRQKKVYCLKKLRCEVTTEYCPPGVAPRRQTSLGERLSHDLLDKLVTNNNMIHNNDFRPAYYVENNVRDSLPTEFPSLLGPPVDLIIITDTTQVEAYSHFAQFKKRLGINAVVKTMTWIRQHYVGIDDAERIRNFIRDAYEKWGISFVLLGGDPPLLPTRYVWVDRDEIYTSLWLPIASDLYYSDLDGTWNADGDEKFGEVSDSLDLFPDVFVGRITTSDSDEVFDYLNKLNSYVFPLNTGIQTKALFFSSKLDHDWPGLPYAYELAEHLPEQFTKSFLDETLNNLSQQTLKDSINAGFGIVTGIGHGDVNTICIHFAYPRSYVPIFYFDSLANTNLYSLMAVITCYTNPFQSDCVGEHWILNPHGGGIAYIGPTSSSEGGLHKDYMVVLYDTLFTFPLGQAFAFSKIPFIVDAQADNWHRVHQFSLSLLGDPTITLWNTSPENLTSVTIKPQKLWVGWDTVTITLEPGVPGHVVFCKEGETFITDSTNTGTFKSCVKTESPGYVKFTVMCDGYCPYSDSIAVLPRHAYLAYEDHVLSGPGRGEHGIIKPGDEIWLDVVLRNNGNSSARDIHAHLVCPDTFLAIMSDTCSFADIAPGDTGSCLSPFHLQISESMPDAYSFDFEIIMDYSNKVTCDSFQIVGAAPVLIHFTQDFSELNDTVTIRPYLTNYGHLEAAGVYGRIRTYSDSVIVIDSMVNFPNIEINEIVSSGSDVFEVYRASPACEVRVNLQIFDDSVEAVNRDITSLPVDVVDAVHAKGTRSSVVLEWSQVFGAVGYRVYRALDVGGPYTFMHNTLEPMCHCEDFDVLPAQDYYYYIMAVDSSMNQGGPSDTVCGRVNLQYAQGWPQTVYDYVFSSPNCGDLDPSYPGLEVVVCGKDGNIYAWHCDGTPVNGFDSRLFQSGGGDIWSSPAIGDVNGDGQLEIVFGITRESDNLYVLSYDPIDKQAQVLPGWPKSLNGGGLVSSPLLADIDGDGDLEIFAVSFAPASVYAFHHDGSGVYEQDSGLLAFLDGVVWGTPAIGDINSDGALEIVCLGGGDTTRLFVWDHDGNDVPPFPLEIESGQVFSVIIGDVIGDQNREICFYIGEPSKKLNLFDNSGTMIWQHSLTANHIELCPALGDMNSDGRPEVVFGYNDGLDEGLIVFDSSGNVLTGFPRQGHDAYPPIIIDANSDDVCDVIVGSTEWNVYAYDNEGTYTSGFPIKLGNRINSSPAAYDIDLDGNLELMVSCYDFQFHVFDLDSRLIEWPRFHYDPYNSGCYKSGCFPAIEDVDRSNIMRVNLEINPNPFRRTTTITFSTGQYTESCPERTSLRIYDAIGRLVKDFDKLDEIGQLKSPIYWHGDDNRGRRVPSGVYFVKIEKSPYTSIQKVVRIQ